jgi:hypothetical protein
MNEDAERWLAFAREDLRMAELAIEETLNPLFIYLTKEFLNKSLTVAYTPALHTLQIRTHTGDQTLTLGTDKEASRTDNLQATSHSNCPGSAFVEQYFCVSNGFCQCNNFGLTVIKQD